MAGDGEAAILTLSDLFDLKLSEGETGGIRLALLSACATGLPGAQLPDEVISLPTGLLQAGVAGVAASLWAVADLSTMMLLTRFYDLWRKDGLEPALALRKAQKWVRDTSNGEKAAYFNLVTLDPNANDFAHPFHWAAFTYVGA
jgi:CHAT domain-containing protein